MMRFLRRLFDLIFWWVVAILCVGFIGFIAWPLLSDKFYSLCTNQDWSLCRGEWSSVSSADEVQKTIEGKTKSFFDIAGAAASDVLTDPSGKKKVTYEYNSDRGVYMPIPAR